MHSHILACSCKVFADMSSLESGPSGGGAPAFHPANSCAPLRLEEPFRGAKLQHVELFLKSMYRPTEVSSRALKSQLPDLPAFQAMYVLADKFDNDALKSTLSEHLASSSPHGDAMLRMDLLGWIEFANRSVNVLAVGSAWAMPACTNGGPSPPLLQVRYAGAARALRGAAAAPAG